MKNDPICPSDQACNCDGRCQCNKLTDALKSVEASGLIRQNQRTSPTPTRGVGYRQASRTNAQKRCLDVSESNAGRGITSRGDQGVLHGMCRVEPRGGEALLRTGLPAVDVSPICQERTGGRCYAFT